MKTTVDFSFFTILNYKFFPKYNLSVPLSATLEFLVQLEKQGHRQCLADEQILYTVVRVFNKSKSKYKMCKHIIISYLMIN